MKSIFFAAPFALSLLLAAACSSSSNGDPGAQGGDAGSSGSSGGADGSSGGSGGPGTFWYLTQQVKKVGVSDLQGNDVFSETITEEPQHLTIGGGAAWVLTDKGTVLRYDLSTHAKISIPAVAKKPSHLVFASGALWVSDDDDGAACTSGTEGPAKVVRVDPATNSVVKSIAVTATASSACNRFDSLVTDGTNVYALVENDFGLARIDPTTNTVAAHVALGTGGGFGTGYAAAGGGKLWVHNTNAHSLQSLDPTALTVVGTPTPISADYLGEHWVATADALYLDKPSKSVLRVDAKTPVTQTPYPILDSPSDMAMHDGHLYTAYTESLTATLVSYDATTLSVASSINSLVFPDKLAFVP